MISRRAISAVFTALLAASACAAAPPDAPQPDRTSETRPSPGRQRVERHMHRFRHLEGTWRTEDAGLRAQFERTAEALVELQLAELRIEATELRDRARERTLRRTPAGARDLQDLEPAHIPAIVLAKLPL